MKNLNNYIIEAWSGVKKHANIEDIKSWCEEMGIQNYTINSQGEIDVDGKVDLRGSVFKELPYKFGKVKGYFNIGENKNLTSLTNCPDEVIYYFACDFCSKLDSLEGCPSYVEWNFYCNGCKRKFTKEEVQSLCKIKGNIKL